MFILQCVCVCVCCGGGGGGGLGLGLFAGCVCCNHKKSKKNFQKINGITLKRGIPSCNKDLFSSIEKCARILHIYTA